MANRKSTQKALAKSLKSGNYTPSKIGAKARAAANKLKTAVTGGKHRGIAKDEDTSYSSYASSESTGRHSKESNLGGKHHAPSAQSAVKNAYGSIDAPSRGRHSKEAHPNGNGTLSLHEAVINNRQFTSSKARMNNNGRT